MVMDFEATNQENINNVQELSNGNIATQISRYDTNKTDSMGIIDANTGSLIHSVLLPEVKFEDGGGDLPNRIKEIKPLSDGNILVVTEHQLLIIDNQTQEMRVLRQLVRDQNIRSCEITDENSIVYIVQDETKRRIGISADPYSDEAEYHCYAYRDPVPQRAA
jgi:hypothetical protein